MTTLLDDALAHHVWATLRLLDACSELTDEQLETTLPGTYGSILETMRHLVASDAGYLNRLSGGRHPRVEEAGMGVVELRSVMERNRELWPELLTANPDPSEMVTVQREDGSSFGAPKGIRLAQVIHHGTDHRSQICTALTSLGIEPPPIDVWDYGEVMGLTRELAASS
ncbi:MAG TPA: DinB family protein [Candidatus Limnocylindria bacterium]|nr:DinB family protein [Candidatus Limnocylindria bacterium]